MNTTASPSPGGFRAIDGTIPAWADRVAGKGPLEFVDSCLRGLGQACFMNNRAGPGAGRGRGGSPRQSST